MTDDELRAWATFFAGRQLPPGPQARAVLALFADRDRLRLELDRIRDDTGVVEHATDDECVGCGCRALTARECVGEVVADRDRQRALVASLCERLTACSEALSRCAERRGA